MDIATRAHRILKPMARYKGLDEHPNSFVLSGCNAPLADQEFCIGIYENTPGSASGTVLITSRGVHIFNDLGWDSLGFDSIDSIQFPAKEPKPNHLVIRTTSGNTFEIPLKGGEGKFSDVFQFMRFLDRVSGDRRLT